MVSRDGADSKWILAQLHDDRPQTFWLYDRAKKTKSLLYSEIPDLAQYKLARQIPVEIKARDGLTLQGYLSIPVGEEPKNLPMIISPHGGPWFRDDWGFEPTRAFLVNRGYAMLEVNYRGSTGFGRAFLQASDHEWGLKTQDDITDAVNWAIKQGYADRHKIAILGASAGGYAVLRGMTTTPELYACGVDIVGPSDLRTVVQSTSGWRRSSKVKWIRLVGDVERDDALNRRLSPLYHADKFRAPILIEQGANDIRVTEKQSAMMVAALRERKIPVTYVVYPDEGHGFNRPENAMDAMQRIETFLQGCLGGRAQPFERVAGSSAEVR